VSLTPDGLPAYARPASSPENRQKFGEVSFVIRGTDEAADWVALPRTTTAALDIFVAEIAPDKCHTCCGGPGPAEVDVERAGSVQGPQGADTVPRTGVQDRELRTFRQPVSCLEFRGCDEKDPRAMYVYRYNIEADPQRFRSALHEEGAGTVQACCRASVRSELPHCAQRGTAVSRPEPFVRQRREGRYEQTGRGAPAVKQMKIEVECVTCGMRCTVQERRAEHEWTRPVSQTAGTSALR
jgi:hypothetical protein